MAGMKDVRRIAWAIFWRASLAALVVGTLGGGVWGVAAGVVGTVAGVPKETLQPIVKWGGGGIGVAASILSFNYFVAWAIGRTIGQKRLELVDASTTTGGR